MVKYWKPAITFSLVKFTIKKKRICITKNPPQHNNLLIFFFFRFLHKIQSSHFLFFFFFIFHLPAYNLTADKMKRGTDFSAIHVWNALVQSKFLDPVLMIQTIHIIDRYHHLVNIDTRKHCITVEGTARNQPLPWTIETK